MHKVIHRLQPEDWYSVSLADLRQVGFQSDATKRELAELLLERYPEFDWNIVRFLKGSLAQQQRLERTVRQLFPVRMNYTLHAQE